LSTTKKKKFYNTDSRWIEWAAPDAQGVRGDERQGGGQHGLAGASKVGKSHLNDVTGILSLKTFHDITSIFNFS
jgi:hypothetical protein